MHSDALYTGIYICLTVFFITKLSNGYQFGAPREACETLTPSHGTARFRDFGYDVTASNTWFYAGQTVTFTVELGDNKGFQGLMMQVRDLDEHATGYFDTPPKASGFKTIDCRGPKDTITHANADSKSSATFVWNAPLTCDEGDYHLRATIVRSFKKIQTDIEVTLECSVMATSANEDLNRLVLSQNVTTLTPNANRSCEVGNETTFYVEEYHTSFENPNDLDMWGVSGWKRHSGMTPSPLTGPKSAAQGRYYMYFETSYPVARGDVATLETKFPNGLQGCYCLMLRLSFYVLENDSHLFEIYAGTKLIYKSSEVHSEWRKLILQVDTNEVSQIRLVGTKGYSFQGDMAVDDVSILPGLCLTSKD